MKYESKRLNNIERDGLLWKRNEDSLYKVCLYGYRFGKGREKTIVKS